MTGNLPVLDLIWERYQPVAGDIVNIPYLVSGIVNLPSPFAQNTAPLATHSYRRLSNVQAIDYDTIVSLYPDLTCEELLKRVKLAVITCLEGIIGTSEGRVSADIFQNSRFIEGISILLLVDRQQVRELTGLLIRRSILYDISLDLLLLHVIDRSALLPLSL